MTFPFIYLILAHFPPPITPFDSLFQFLPLLLFLSLSFFLFVESQKGVNSYPCIRSQQRSGSQNNEFVLFIFLPFILSSSFTLTILYF